MSFHKSRSVRVSAHGCLEFIRKKTGMDTYKEKPFVRITYTTQSIGSSKREGGGGGGVGAYMEMGIYSVLIYTSVYLDKTLTQQSVNI